MSTQNRYHNLLLATADQSRNTDRLTIESLGLPGETLMEIAGNRAADIIASDFPKGGSVLFVCGKGNNAGDAFVAARILLDKGFRVTFYPVFGTDDLSGDCGRNYSRLNQMAEAMEVEVPYWKEWKDPSNFDLIADGIFGTGLQREVKSPVSDIIRQINDSGRPVYALDIPSGLHCDTGEILGTAVMASKTVQFGLRKIGCYMGDGPACSGERVQVELPFPGIYKKEISVRLIEERRDPVQMLRQYSRTSAGSSSPPRKKTLHKYNNGVVHVIGGSAGLTGAPLYAARAAWSLGMGAVTLIHPSAWSTTMDIQAPELIKKPAGSAGSKSFTEEHADEVLSFIHDRKGVTIIGPGIGRNSRTQAFVRRIVHESNGPVIIDADGLRAFAGSFEAISGRSHPEQVILTPHPGELAHMTNKSCQKDIERLQCVMELSAQTGCVLLSKGNPVFIHSSHTSQTLLTGYDTTLFARAGFGDILAGHIASFYSRCNDPLDSCENGLLYGYNKINDISSRGTLFPEPSDLA